MVQGPRPHGGHVHELERNGMVSPISPHPTPLMEGLAGREGDTWHFNNDVSWNDFRETIQQGRISHLWEQASKHRGSDGMVEGVDRTVTIKNYNILFKEGTTAEAAALMSITTGALWSLPDVKKRAYPTRGRDTNAPFVANRTPMRVPLLAML